MSRRPSDPSPTQVAAALMLLAVCGLPARWAWGWTGRIRDTLRNDRPNAVDYERLEHSYYERICGQTGRAKDNAPKPFDAGVLAIVVDDAREYVLKPNLDTLHRGARWTTNIHGQRDRDRATTKPLGVFRIALVGDSIGSGWGVNDEQSFTRLLEQSFKEQGRPIEVLNFAVPGHAPGQRWEHFLKVGWKFEPDLVVFEGSTADILWDERRVRAFTARGLGEDSPVYGDLIRGLGLSRDLEADEIKERLKPHRDRVLPSIYRKIASDCRANRVACLGLLVPRVGKQAVAEERRRMKGWAGDAGFSAWLDLSDAFDGLDAQSLAIAADDFHPNADGHARLARRIEEFLGSSGLLTDRMHKEGSPQ